MEITYFFEESNLALLNEVAPSKTLRYIRPSLSFSLARRYTPS